MLLTELKTGQEAIITRVKGIGAFRKRIMEMGFLVGKEVVAIRKAPMQDPVEYYIMGYHVSLRNSEAELIEVELISEDYVVPPVISQDSIEGDLLEYYQVNEKLNVAFVGNPNSGKTTLYNKISNSNEKVGNYAGVTVDIKETEITKLNTRYKLTDLPGTYSLTAYSPEEIFIRDFITHQLPDVVVNVIDATNLERNLYLTMQLIDMDIKVVIALNMYDELQYNGDKLDYETLGRLIGIPIVPTVASRGRGIHNLLAKIKEVAYDQSKTHRHVHINYGENIENAIRLIREEFENTEDKTIFYRLSKRFLAIKLLEKDVEAIELIKDFSNYESLHNIVEKQIELVENQLNDDTENIITNAKYGFISGALKETYFPKEKDKKSRTQIIDNVLTHKFWGIPIFFLFMFVTFFSTFTLGEYPMQGIEWIVEQISIFVNKAMPDGMLKDLLVQGIIGGVGGVIVFLPNILILYLFISLMEDTGYMARAVFIMDKAMHKIGLHGKSFIPLIMGFGCNVPAIMGTRIIESRKDKMITMLIIPFMSCSARLPVFILLISAFFQNHKTLILFSLYAFGIILAAIGALIFRKIFFKKEDLPFVMELPPYRTPTSRNIVYQMLKRTGYYIKKIGGVILVASIIIWALGYFPKNFKGSEIYANKIEQLESEKLLLESQTPDNVHNIQIIDDSISNLKWEHSMLQQQNSYIGKIGKFVEPIVRPLGFDWKMSIALITGIAAKEVVVGTMGVLYHSKEESETDLTIKLKDEKFVHGPKAGQPVYSPLVALSLMLFILIYFPCVGVIATIRKESGHWKWAIFVEVFTTALAYFVSLMVYQIGLLIL